MQPGQSVQLSSNSVAVKSCLNQLCIKLAAARFRICLLLRRPTPGPASSATFKAGYPLCEEKGLQPKPTSGGRGVYLSYSLNSLKGGNIREKKETAIGVIKGDTRSLDSSSLGERASEPWRGGVDEWPRGFDHQPSGCDAGILGISVILGRAFSILVTLVRKIALSSPSDNPSPWTPNRSRDEPEP